MLAAGDGLDYSDDHCPQLHECGDASWWNVASGLRRLSIGQPDGELSKLFMDADDLCGDLSYTSGGKRREEEIASKRPGVGTIATCTPCDRFEWTGGCSGVGHCGCSRKAVRPRLVI